MHEHHAIVADAHAAMAANQVNMDSMETQHHAGADMDREGHVPSCVIDMSDAHV